MDPLIQLYLLHEELQIYDLYQFYFWNWYSTLGV